MRSPWRVNWNPALAATSYLYHTLGKNIGEAWARTRIRIYMLLTRTEANIHALYNSREHTLNIVHSKLNIPTVKNIK